MSGPIFGPRHRVQTRLAWLDNQWKGLAFETERPRKILKTQGHSCATCWYVCHIYSGNPDLRPRRSSSGMRYWNCLGRVDAWQNHLEYCAYRLIGVAHHCIEHDTI